MGEDFLERLGQEEQQQPIPKLKTFKEAALEDVQSFVEDREEEDREEQQQPIPKLKTFKEAISALEDVQSFVEDRDTSVKRRRSSSNRLSSRFRCIIAYFVNETENFTKLCHP